MRKGEEVKYELIEEKQAPKNEKVYIFVSE